MDLTYALGLACALLALGGGGYAMVHQTIAMIAYRRWSADRGLPAIWTNLQLYSRRRYREVAAEADQSVDARKATRAWRRSLLGTGVFIAMVPLMWLVLTLR